MFKCNNGISFYSLKIINKLRFIKRLNRRSRARTSCCSWRVVSLSPRCLVRLVGSLNCTLRRNTRNPRRRGEYFFYFRAPLYHFGIGIFGMRIIFKNIFRIEFVIFSTNLKLNMILSCATIDRFLPAISNMNTVKICLVSMICTRCICRHFRMAVNRTDNHKIIRLHLSNRVSIILTVNRSIFLLRN